VGTPVLIDSTILMGLIFFAIVATFIAFLGLALGGPILRGRLPGGGAWYLLYGTVTKFGYTTDIIGNVLRMKLGKSKLSFIVNPAHRTYLWGKPLYILSTEYGTSIHPSMLAILTALRELGREDMIKDYLELNYAYNKLANSIANVEDNEQKEELERTLEQIEKALKAKEQEMRAFVDKNAHVIEVKQNLEFEELASDKQVLVVRQVDPALIGEYSTGITSPKLTGNMELYALEMSSILKSDVVKFAFAAMLIIIGLAFAYMLLQGQQPPKVDVKISPELLHKLANETAKNATKVVKI